MTWSFPKVSARLDRLVYVLQQREKLWVVIVQEIWVCEVSSTHICHCSFTILWQDFLVASASGKLFIFIHFYHILVKVANIKNDWPFSLM